ncbi:MAG: VCBS repeat-containing protein [Deltaproteobacteria bacterium]|nr:VCBS repeat-containing protein [Deltaproteobacteria bacterium]
MSSTSASPSRALLGVLALGVAASLTLYACSGEAPKPVDGPKPAAQADKGKAKGDAAAASGPPAPVQDKIEGPQASAILLSQAWFYKDANGKQKPGPARLQIWRQGAAGWSALKLEDGDSNVFHKAIPTPDGGLLTIGAEKALLKKWTLKDGAWQSELLWGKPEGWGGQFNRLRDLEIGDVDGDGKDELVMATHDGGVIVVYNPGEGGAPPEVIELDAKADTFVHEIEIGDMDGDGKKEFYATPSDRNKANASQAGEIVMYTFADGKYTRSVIDGGPHTHAKEVLATDLDHDGKSEVFSVLEAEIDAAKTIVKPVEIRRYTKKADGSGFDHQTVATIQDRQTRFLVVGDFDGDGFDELVAASFKTGLYFIDGKSDGKGGFVWDAPVVIDAISSGFEHAAYPADLDGDGKIELYVAADDQRELKRYDFNAETRTFTKQKLGALDAGTLTWNISAMKL